MRAKLFDAHNKFLQDHELPEAVPTVQIAGKTFRLADTDDSGALVYREVDYKTTAAVEKSSASGKAGE
jgi:hypothetical protein